MVIRQPASWAMNAASSSASRHRQSIHNRSSAIRRHRGAARPRSPPASGSRPPPPIVTANEGSKSSGRAPEPIWLRHASTATGRAGHLTQNTAASRNAVCSDLLDRTGQQPQRRQLLGQTLRREIEQQHLLQRSQPGLVQAKGALQRIAVQSAIKSILPTTNPA